MAFECVSRTHVGLRRKVNEDALVVRSDRGLWAVADGMGGHDAGDVASAKVTEALARLPVVYQLDEMIGAATTALQRVNRELIAIAGTRGSDRGMGSTIVGLACRGADYRCFWVGDSRAYLLRGETIVRLTRDHSLVQDLVDAGMIGATEAEGHPNANVITRAVGAAEELRIDTVHGKIEPGDRFLLASDGLTRLVDDRELRSTLLGMPAEDAADTLVDRVLARGAPDNVTLIILTAT